jgi:hypothetical protein
VILDRKGGGLRLAAFLRWFNSGETSRFDDLTAVLKTKTPTLPPFPSGWRWIRQLVWAKPNASALLTKVP